MAEEAGGRRLIREEIAPGRSCQLFSSSSVAVAHVDGVASFSFGPTLSRVEFHEVTGVENGKGFAPVSGTPNYVLYDTFTSLADVTNSGGAGSWMNHYPFGGSECTLSANSELEYCTSATRTPGFSPFKAAAQDRGS